MGKKTVFVTSAIVLIFSFVCGHALADGGFFGKGGRDISEPEQKAVIFFHEGEEELVLSVRFDGASEEFAWLVPTPQPPRVEESDIGLFEGMSTVTQSGTTHWQDGGTLGMDNAMKDGADVLEELTVGAFDLTVLRADDAGDLRSWLEERGFAYDGEAEEVLAGYIERGWCFTAMRISPSSGDSMHGDLDYQLSEGTIDPLRFSFGTPEPVYPLRISSLNPGKTEVLLYVLGPQAYGHDSMRMEYAERWQPVQIGAFGRFSALAAKMQADGGCYVTKMRHAFAPEEMEDLYLSPLEPAQLERWSSLGVVAEAGGGVPWWGLLAIVLALAALAVAAYVFSGEREDTRWKKALTVFLAAALVGSAVLFPLGLWVLPADEVQVMVNEAVPQPPWPWEEDILISDGGWSKLVHPDGRVEIEGMDAYLSWTINPPEMGLEEFSGDPVSINGNLDEEGRWQWGVRFHRADTWQTRYLVVTETASGEISEVEIGMKDVHGARISPQGDRLWVAMNPGVPVNVTEVQEYAFPSLELNRSLIHDDCMNIGEIVVSKDGEPLLAGRFSSGGEDMDTTFGFLPMFEEGARFTGKPFVIVNETEGIKDIKLISLLNNYFCDALDARPFLLLAGYDYETGDGLTYVLDSSDGSIYEVCHGSPRGWRE